MRSISTDTTHLPETSNFPGWKVGIKTMHLPGRLRLELQLQLSCVGARNISVRVMGTCEGAANGPKASNIQPLQDELGGRGPGLG